MLCLYVDDILIFGSNLNVIEEVKKLLSSNFDMKDLGEADVILNINLIKKVMWGNFVAISLCGKGIESLWFQ